MASRDIGIDLGTATTLIYVHGKGIVLREPSIVAVNADTGKIVNVGMDAYNMLGKTPDRIQVYKPLEDGVISDYEHTGEMLKYFLKKALPSSIFKPRVCVCVPSGVTEVESRAVIDTVLSAGARKVYLVEEPVAAALGAGLDVTKAGGSIILDMGGGTTDIAVMSLSGIVCKESIKVAGNRFNSAIVRYIRDKYNVLVGDATAEKAKIEFATVYRQGRPEKYMIKGRNLLTGFPQKLEITNHELVEPLLAEAELVVHAIQSVLERTPPELASDLYNQGMVMTGGGAMLRGLDVLFSKRTNIHCRLADNPVECVAVGVGKSFDYLDKLYDGFVNHTVYQ